MLCSLEAGSLTLRGLSLGGVYTTLLVPEYHAVFDIGLAPRSFAGAKRLFLSHGHVDHVGALLTLLGIRALSGIRAPLRIYMPAEIRATVEEMLAVASRFQRNAIRVDAVPLLPGDRVQVDGGLWVEAFRTEHSVPSLGYKLLKVVDKLKPAFQRLPGAEIAARRAAGEILTERHERPQFAYVTDTRASVLDEHPSLYEVPTLVIESTFLDERRSVADARARYHIHYDELVERSELFRNERIVLMHFSQHYSPAAVRRLVAARESAFACPVMPLVPATGDWPG